MFNVAAIMNKEVGMKVGKLVLEGAASLTGTAVTAIYGQRFTEDVKELVTKKEAPKTEEVKAKKTK